LQIHSDFSINSLKIFKELVFLSMRSGDVVIVNLKGENDQRINKFSISQDPSIIIESVTESNQGYTLLLLGEEDCYSVTVKPNLQSMRKSKFVVNERFKYS
jgi:hypothetical protein